MSSSWLRAPLRALVLGLVAVGLSLPLVFSLHSHFDLGAPPLNGLWTLGIGVVGAFVGAAMLGVWAATFRAPGVVAAVFGLVWGVALAFWLGSFYTRLVLREATPRAVSRTELNRERIASARHETPEQARAGHASREAARAGVEFSDDAHAGAIKGAARLPALGLLGWVLLVPPLLCAFECRRAKR